MAALDATVAAGLEGSVLLVIGEPGIGKSSLLAAARSTALASGFSVLRATGIESEIHLPFGGIHQALGPLMRHAAVLPTLQREALFTALGLSDGGQPDLFQIAQAAFALLLCERAERPVLIVVDDVHWLDPQSQQIFTFLAHRGLGSGICVVGAIRPDHPGPFADAGFPRLRVGGVDDDTADRILRRHAGTLSVAHLARIRQEAMGNPLALSELPRSWGDGPPTDGHPVAVSARLERAFAGRIADLPAGTRDALLILAVGSSSNTDEILSALSAFGTAGALPDHFQPAITAGLITDRQTKFEFRHPLVRSAVLQLETLARRHAAHGALAEVLLPGSYRRAWHRAWSIIGPDDDIADALAATVPDSLRRGAVMTAVSSLERAAELTTSSSRRGQRLLEAAGHAFGSGRPDVVARILRQASEVDLTDLDEIRVIWLTEALNDDVRANSPLVHELCESARRANELGDSGLALDLLNGAALRCWWVDSGEDDRSEVLRILDGLTDRDDPRHLAAVSIAEPVLRGSEVMNGLATVSLAEVSDADSLRFYAQAAYGVGDFVMATDLLDRAEELLRRQGRLGMLPLVLALQLQIRLHLGDWSGAAAASDEVVSVARETGQGLFAENNVLVEARGMALRGEWESALEVMSGAESEALRLRLNDRICLAYQARGAALLSADRPDAAFACLKRQFDPTDPGYHLRESFAGIALTAEAAADCGQIEEARAVVDALATVAVVTPSPVLEVNLLYARAVLAREDLKEARYREALSRDLTRWPWLLARLQLAYGRWLTKAGRYSEARSLLHAALEEFVRIGAVRWRRCAALALGDLDGSGSASSGPSDAQ